MMHVSITVRPRGKLKPEGKYTTSITNIGIVRYSSEFAFGESIKVNRIYVGTSSPLYMLKHAVKHIKPGPLEEK